MSFVTWNSDLAVGHTQMDGQHQALIDIVNRYHDALAAKAPQRKLVAIFEEVADYARYHFRDEEALMERSGYPGLARHRIIHGQLLDRVTELLLRLRAGEPGIDEQIQFFLKNWLTAHIKGIDRQYRPFVEAKAA
ncbi:MAG: bacteriohemerythrin [Pseudomonadota bacterium]|jgi:hemerythrin-like metal-binding protein